MFERRRLPMFLSILLSILLAAGFIPYSMGLLPMLKSLYFNGWWTLLLILPSLAKFIQDGYSRPALGILASGLLLFANATGKIPAGMLPESAAYTALASVAGGAAIELTAWRQKKKLAALPGKQQEKLKESKSPFAPETEKKAEPAENSYIPKRAASDVSANTYSSKGWTPPVQQACSAEKDWTPPTKTASESKGWDPNKTYTRPENAKMRTTTPQQIRPKQSFSLSNLFGNGSFPVSIAIFGDSKINCNHQDITGGLVLSLFGSAKLSLRDADYHQPASVLMLSVFGDTKLEVPYVSNISYTGIPIFGDCKDKRKLVNSDQMPILSIQSFSIFGSNTIQ